MTYLHVIVPTRARPHIVSEMTEAFRATCEPKPYNRQTRLTFAVDDDDPARPEYEKAIAAVPSATNMVDWGQRGTPQVPVAPDMVIVGNLTEDEGTGMVGALNSVAMRIICGSINPNRPAGIAFMGDDHRPRTKFWDAQYVSGLALAHIVYGDDMFQGQNLPTQAAVRTSTVCALGFFFPPVLKHLYADNYLLSLGHALNASNAGTGIVYMPNVQIEHMHPAAGKAVNDENYQRVNAHDIASHDEQAYLAWVRDNLRTDLERIQAGV